jgi:hypothetical protein
MNKYCRSMIGGWLVGIISTLALAYDRCPNPDSSDTFPSHRVIALSSALDVCDANGFGKSNSPTVQLGLHISKRDVQETARQRQFHPGLYTAQAHQPST